MMLLLGLAQAAIVNVLSPQVGAPEPGVHGSLRAGGRVALGNVDMSVLELSSGVRFVGDRHTVLLSASGNRTLATDVLTVDQGFLHLRDTWSFSDPWATYVFLQADHNAFRSMQLRNLAGAGVQRRLWRTEWTEATLGTSLMGEYQLLTEGAEDEDAGLHARSSSFLTLAFAGDWGVAASTTFFQPRVDLPSNLRVYEELSLTLHLTEHLDWNAVGRVEWDRDPPVGREAVDLTASTGVVASF